MAALAALAAFDFFLNSDAMICHAQVGDEMHQIGWQDQV